jgi:hypothetical protein
MNMTREQARRLGEALQRFALKERPTKFGSKEGNEVN